MGLGGPQGQAHCLHILPHVTAAVSECIMPAQMEVFWVGVLNKLGGHCLQAPKAGVASLLCAVVHS